MFRIGPGSCVITNTAKRLEDKLLRILFISLSLALSNGFFLGASRPDDAPKDEDICPGVLCSAACIRSGLRSVWRYLRGLVTSGADGSTLQSANVVLLLRGTCQGKSTVQMARKLDLSRTTVHNIRQQLQANAALLQPESSVSDDQTETDEMFQNAGKKGEPHQDPTDPPRRRAKQGPGTRNV